VEAIFDSLDFKMLGALERSPLSVGGVEHVDSRQLWFELDTLKDQGAFPSGQLQGNDAQGAVPGDALIQDKDELWFPRGCLDGDDLERLVLGVIQG
jgi:hypothetical protein